MTWRAALPPAAPPAGAPGHREWPRHPTGSTRVCWATGTGFPRGWALPLCRVVVALPLPAAVGGVIPEQLLGRDVERPHSPVVMGRARPATPGNAVLLPHPRLVVIARLAVDLKSPWGRQDEQGNQLLLKIPGDWCHYVLGVSLWCLRSLVATGQG